jgi:hypothetical protein
MKLKALAVGAMICLAGCATVKTWQATGGSRSDGTVRLSYEYGMFESPTLTDNGVRIATDRCKVWGYSGAEPFGGQTQVCNQFSSSGCMTWLVTKEFQCTGQGNGGHAEIRLSSASYGTP